MMDRRFFPAARILSLILACLLVLALLAACAAQSEAPANSGEFPAGAPAQPTGEAGIPPAAEVPEGSPLQGTPLPLPTQAGVIGELEEPAEEPAVEEEAPAEPREEPAVPTAAPEQEEPPQEAEPEPVIEGRLVELEWPDRLRMGESDVIRLALVPTREGYEAQAEFPDHTVQTMEIPVPRPDGYVLYAVARLDGVAFDISPAGEQERLVPPGEEVAWRWTLSARQAGRQRLSVQLHLRWEPGAGLSGAVREAQAFSRGLDVQVLSFLGMSQAQAASTGFVGLVASVVLLMVSVVSRRIAPPARTAAGRDGILPAEPNPRVVIETSPGLSLAGEERGLLQALFQRYARLVIENEFLSGYSGARTFLVRPVRPDENADALTIVKLGPREAIRREFNNYETFVKDRLPPVTARIQRPPVAVTRSAGSGSTSKAAVQYTFIAEPGHAPVSLRKALLDHPDPALLMRLFETFGPHWWMQRRPYTFRLELEYDALLPPHYVLEPFRGERPDGKMIFVDETTPLGGLNLDKDQVVAVRPFQKCELRADGRSLTLRGMPPAGQPALRLRWLSPEPPRKPGPMLARVTAARASLLEDLAAGFRGTGTLAYFEGLADPLALLPAVLKETVSGTRSVIHGDLNLENILVGPGSLVWLIDFAETREGHPLFDFAHLESELIAHVLAPRCVSPVDYLNLWRAGDPLLETVHGLAARCLFDPARPREYQLALYLACLGALKYQNLSQHSKHCLYLTAADLSGKIE